MNRNSNPKFWKIPWLVVLITALVGVLSCTSAQAKDHEGEKEELSMEEKRQKAMEASPQWKDGKFVNTIERVDGSMGKMFRKFWNNPNKQKNPTDPIPVLQYDQKLSQATVGELQVTWMGHSSILLEIDQHKVLIDPVWSKRPSPFSFVGPKRFHEPPISLQDLPEIDVVVISHDHYDHLDKETIKQIKDKVQLFAVPLGIGEYLEDWGVAPEKIQERDWWGTVEYKDLQLTATPARHFSGRMSPVGNKTLWCGWAIVTANHRVYYSGDTAMFPGFTEIGERLGPFDLTMIESGAYDELWADVHLGPEQAVKAHQMVRGKVMLPVHWGTFDLALHNWTEPAERIQIAAQKDRIETIFPKPGETLGKEFEFRNMDNMETTKWWPDVPFQTAEEHPVISSGLSANIYEGLNSTMVEPVETKSENTQNEMLVERSRDNDESPKLVFDAE